MKLNFQRSFGPFRACAAFTLAEVLICSGIAALTISGILYGYIQSTKQAEWSGFSLAAQSLALQRMEQTRASKWDPEASPPVDELVSANFPLQILTLDLPTKGTNILYATNITTISTITVTPPCKMIQVITIWPFPSRGTVHTNRLVTYRTSDT